MGAAMTAVEWEILAARVAAFRRRLSAASTPEYQIMVANEIGRTPRKRSAEATRAAVDAFTSNLLAELSARAAAPAAGKNNDG